MKRRRLRRIVLVSATSALALITGYVEAQQRTQKDPTFIKPAQAESPAAHPTTLANSGQRQFSDRRDNVNQGGASERTRTDTTRQTVRRGDRTGRENNLNPQLAACLLTKNKGEVELGKFASERAKDRDVKEFAEQMIKDHSKIVDQLEQVVGSQEPNDRRSKIAREIDEQILASIKKELGDKSEKEFVRCYMGSQISGHMEMAAALKVISNHASGELSQIVNDARPTVDKHLQHAKELMDQLDQSRDHAQASKDRSDRTR